jgi:hypothetical protein
MIYQFAAQKANISIENIAFVDDRLAFVQGAENVHMNAWLIDRVIDDPYQSITKPLVLNRIENLRELLHLVHFSKSEMVSNDQGQCPLTIQDKDIFWEYCELPAANPPMPIYEEINHAGRTISAYLSGLAK